MMTNKNTYRGFTLVELLIAISLIGILTGVLLAVINPRGIQARARDSQRVSDLAKIKVALENYFADNRVYPSNSDSVAGYVDISTFSAVLEGKYINKLSDDPKETGVLCDNANEWRGYAYSTSVNGTSYVLATAMETSSMGNPCSTCTGCNVKSGKGMLYYTTAD